MAKKTHSRRLSEDRFYLFELTNEGTPQQTWINERVYNKKTGQVIDLPENPEIEDLNKVLTEDELDQLM